MVPKLISNGTAKIISNGGAKIISNGGAKYRIASTDDMEQVPAQNYAVILQDSRGNYLSDGVVTGADGSYSLSVRLGVIVPSGQTKAVAQVVAYNDAKAIVSAQVIFDRAKADKQYSVNLDKVSTLMAMTGKAAIAAGKDPEAAVNAFQAASPASLLDKAGEALMSIAVVSLDKMSELINLNPEVLIGDDFDQQILDEISNKLDEAQVIAPPDMKSIIDTIKQDVVTVIGNAEQAIGDAPVTPIATPEPPTPAPGNTPTPAPTPRPTITSVAITTPTVLSINALPPSGPLAADIAATATDSVKLTATVTANFADTGVDWVIYSGADLATVDDNGLVQAKRQNNAGTIVVQASSKDNPSKYARITIQVTNSGVAEIEVK
jgi:hypothetical protein